MHDALRGEPVLGGPVGDLCEDALTQRQQRSGVRYAAGELFGEGVQGVVEITDDFQLRGVDLFDGGRLV